MYYTEISFSMGNTFHVQLQRQPLQLMPPSVALASPLPPPPPLFRYPRTERSSGAMAMDTRVWATRAESGQRTPLSGVASVQRHDLRHRVERWRVALGRSLYLIAARRFYLLKRSRDVSPWARCFVRVKKNRSARTETQIRRRIPESTGHPEKYVHDYMSSRRRERRELRSRKP